jgi:protein arginine kinase activator
MLSPLFLSDELLFPIPLPCSPAARGQAPARKCPVCGAVFSELAALGRMGCAVCYSAFAEELAPAIRAAHGRGEHRGKVSAGHRARMELTARLESLRQQLKQAVEAEEYEGAARLRDEIRGLEAAL